MNRSLQQNKFLRIFIMLWLTVGSSTLSIASEPVVSDCELVLAMTRIEFRDPSTTSAKLSAWRKGQIKNLLEVKRTAHGLSIEEYFFQVANMVPAHLFRETIKWLNLQLAELTNKMSQSSSRLSKSEAELVRSLLSLDKLEKVNRILQRKLRGDALINSSEILSMALYLRKANKNLDKLMNVSAEEMTLNQRRSLLNGLSEDLPWEEMDRSLTHSPIAPYSQTHETYQLIQRGLLAVPWVASMLGKKETALEVKQALLALGVVVIFVDQDQDIVPNLYSGQVPFRLEETLLVRLFGSTLN